MEKPVILLNKDVPFFWDFKANSLIFFNTQIADKIHKEFFKTLFINRLNS
ncbi:hypothetical protein RU85_GL000373 [Lactococcus garvieae]|nr:hypothetical protein RU85_GL000373 [Lactococcus garvieae]